MRHAVLILSVSNRGPGNKLAELMGWGPENYTVKLSDRADGAVTHYGLATPVSELFVGFYDEARKGNPPRGLPPQAIEVVPWITVDYDPAVPEEPALYSTPREHFDAVLARMNLREV